MVSVLPSIFRESPEQATQSFVIAETLVRVGEN